MAQLKSSHDYFGKPKANANTQHNQNQPKKDPAHSDPELSWRVAGC
jgi:hypothetical protein